MKHHINLYGAEFRPRRLWASLPQMALVWGGVLVLLLGPPSSMAGNSRASIVNWLACGHSSTCSAARPGVSMRSWRAIWRM